jgi:hypothetical protein
METGRTIIISTCFLSKTLLSKVIDKEVFHLDATYRILKLCYPVIVFGVSDVNRKFFPVCFMITSYETEFKVFSSPKKNCNHTL